MTIKKKLASYRGDNLENMSNRLNKLLFGQNDLSVCPEISDKTQLNIDISSFCSSKCVYCYYSQSGHHKRGCHIDEDVFFSVANQAFLLGVRDIGLYLTGDPLTNPKAETYVAFLKNLGYRYIFLSTNGLLCSPPRLERLVDAGMSSIKFSLSGANEASFLRHHQVNGFETAYSNLRYAYEYRKKHNYQFKIYVYSVVTKQNYHQMEQMQNLFMPYCDELIFGRVLNTLNQLDNILSEMFLSEKDLTPFPIANLRPIVPCASLFNRINVTSEGLLSICCSAFTKHLSNATCVADLREMSLLDAYYCDAFKNIREKHIKMKVQNTICNRCVFGVNEVMYSARSNWKAEAFTLDKLS